jgi:argininosuccinate lyase
MPQKRNPDVLELIRARAGRLRGRLHELEMIVAKLPSSYHRDLQLTKEPVIRAASDGEDMLRIATRIVEKFAVHGDRLRAAMTPELYATDAALDLVRQGAPFRQAYRRIADDLAAGRFSPRTADPAPRTGAIDARVIGEITAELAGLDQRFASVNSAVERVERAAFDPPR